MKEKKANRDKVRNVRFTFLISNEEKEQTEALADEMGVNMSFVGRIALKEYLKKAKKSYDGE